MKSNYRTESSDIPQLHLLSSLCIVLDQIHSIRHQYDVIQCQFFNNIEFHVRNKITCPCHLVV